jgi:5-methylcytosine-specific restriction endonuclease McrA
MPKRWCIGCRQLFDMDSTGTLRCPACQTAATARRNQRPNSAARGYDGEYQRNKPIIIQQGRDGRPCVICRKPFTPRNKITVEHIKPLRDGGSNDLANLGPAHAWCNTGWNRGQQK